MSESHFNFYTQNKEWNLYNGVAGEFIGMYGVPTQYLRRSDFNPDRLFGEDPNAEYKFDKSFDIKMYIENSADFEGADELYSKIGLQVDNTLNLHVQMEYINNRIGGIPMPADLIYIPMMNGLFEIMKAEEKSTFYLFGRLMTYKIVAKRMEYSHEQMSTAIDEVDALNTQYETVPNTSDNTTDADAADVVNFDEKNPFNDI